MSASCVGSQLPMGRPLRLVQIAHFPVLPAPAGGKIRIVQLARALAALGVEVTLVTPFHPGQRRALAEREPFTLREVPYPFLIPLLFTDRPVPYGALVSFHPGYRALLPLSLAGFDVCQVEHPAFVDLLDRLPSSQPVVYGSQNVEFDYVCAESPGPLVRRLAGARVRALERRLVRRASHVFACSELDRDRFRELYDVPAASVSVLPNGIDLAAVDARRAGRAPVRPVAAGARRRAVFTGSAVRHNLEAARALLEQVAPALEGEVELVVLGACARRFRRTRARNVVLDPEGQLADWAGPGAVGLNAVVRGSGTSLKLLDYLAHDMPVLSTPFGLRGFEELAPWVATADFASFPDALRRELPRPPGLRAKLAAYEWRRIAEDALRVYASLAAA